MNVNLERAQLLYQQSRYELAEPELRQALAAERFGDYRPVLAVTVCAVALTLGLLASLGREAKGKEMTAS